MCECVGARVRARFRHVVFNLFEVLALSIIASLDQISGHALQEQRSLVRLLMSLLKAFLHTSRLPWQLIDQVFRCILIGERRIIKMTRSVALCAAE